MGRTPYIPLELTKKPFSLDEARSAGLTLSALKGKAWPRLGAELYCRQGLRADPWELLSAWRRMLPSNAVFAGATAAWIHGLDFQATDPIEIVMPHDSGVRSRPGLSVRHRETRSSETVNIRGLKATALQRTLRDLCHQWPAAEALVAIDMALHLGLTDSDSLGCARGRRLRKLAAMAAPAESPMETRLRWLLLEAGLLRPEVQTNLHNSDGRFVGRADLYYPAARLVIEYDGGNHRDRLVEDNRRQNLMVNAGFRLLRFTAADIRNRPDVVAAQVRSLLAPY
jgi:very-short-patch-repair endonuclease